MDPDAMLIDSSGNDQPGQEAAEVKGVPDLNAFPSPMEIDAPRNDESGQAVALIKDVPGGMPALGKPPPAIPVSVLAFGFGQQYVRCDHSAVASDSSSALCDDSEAPRSVVFDLSSPGRAQASAAVAAAETAKIIAHQHDNPVSGEREDQFDFGGIGVSLCARLGCNNFSLMSAVEGIGSDRASPEDPAIEEEVGHGKESSASKKRRDSHTGSKGGGEYFRADVFVRFHFPCVRETTIGYVASRPLVQEQNHCNARKYRRLANLILSVLCRCVTILGVGLKNQSRLVFSVASINKQTTNDKRQSP